MQIPTIYLISLLEDRSTPPPRQQGHPKAPLPTVHEPTRGMEIESDDDDDDDNDKEALILVKAPKDRAIEESKMMVLMRTIAIRIERLEKENL